MKKKLKSRESINRTYDLLTYEIYDLFGNNVIALEFWEDDKNDIHEPPNEVGIEFQNITEKEYYNLLDRGTSERAFLNILYHYKKLDGFSLVNNVLMLEFDEDVQILTFSLVGDYLKIKYVNESIVKEMMSIDLTVYSFGELKEIIDQIIRKFTTYTLYERNPNKK